MTENMREPNPESPFTVYKYTLHLDDTVEVVMPKGAEVLSVGEQNGLICVWARVDTREPSVKRLFRVAGTGHPDPRGNFVGVVMQHGGALVWHIFDLGEA